MDSINLVSRLIVCSEKVNIYPCTNRKMKGRANLERKTKSINGKPVRFNLEVCHLLNDSFQQDPQYVIKASKRELEMRNC